MIHDVAWQLGKDINEVRDMDPLEFARWVAFFKIVRKAQQGKP